ncbi:MAG TPA: hypothetical protein VGM80_06110 [Gaiellaceae bacterium]|jgi:hypothetical protein
MTRRARRRTWILLAVTALAALGVRSSLGSGSYNTTDPTVFAPHCQSPLHRNHKHCLDGSVVGGVTLTGTTRAGNSTSAKSTSNTIEMLSGEEYEFALDTPPPCPAVLKKPQDPCTERIDWAPVYGASLADWGVDVQNTLNVVPYAGCDANSRDCNFTVEYETPEGPDLQDGTALRVTAVANVYGLPCGKTTVGFCEHWLDWRLRLHNGTVEPATPRTTTEVTTTTPSKWANAPPGTVAAVEEIKAVAPDKPAHAVVQRDGKGPFKPLGEGGFLGPGDVIRTDGNTVMSLELALGGRVGLNKGTEVEVTGVRSVKDTSTDELTVSKGGLWAKCGALKEPIEIQTNGGVMGIKG